MLRCLTLAFIFCLFTAPAFAVDSWLRYKSAVSPYVLTDNVGIGIRIPTQRLDVDGAVKATTYYGDGSHLTGVGGAAAWGSITGTVTAQTDLGIYALDSDLAAYVPRVDAAMYASSATAPLYLTSGNMTIDVSGLGGAETDPVWTADKAGYVTEVEGSVYVTKGTLTNTKWCVTDGLVVNCTQDAPTGSGLSYGQVQRLIAIGD
jgi:hypothetical protein